MSTTYEKQQHIKRLVNSKQQMAEKQNPEYIAQQPSMSPSVSITPLHRLNLIYDLYKYTESILVIAGAIITTNLWAAI